MKAIVVREPGGPEVLLCEERPVPDPGADHVLIQVHAAGVNRPDLAQRKGHYPAPAGAPPDIPGLEVSGRIVSCGRDVHRFKAGDTVCALIAGGGYAEFAVAHEGHCLPVPKRWTTNEASTLPEAVFTVWHNVFERSKLQPGEHILIHGGMSGIGVTAIQMAKAAGAEVMVTCGSDDKCSRALMLGATVAINYKTADFQQQVINATSGKGVDVILDMIGAPYFEKNISILAGDGRLALINFMGGDETSIRLSSILRKRLTITGSTLRNRSNEFKTLLTQEVRNHVWPWLEAGKIVPVIDSVYDLSNADSAHRHMESGLHAGKIMLVTEAGKASA